MCLNEMRLSIVTTCSLDRGLMNFQYNIMKTCLYNFDPLQSHFYIVKLRFTGVYIIFLICAQNIGFVYSLEPPRRGGSNEYPQSIFWAEIWKISEFLSENFQFLEVKFSIYLNMCVFVMLSFFTVMRTMIRMRDLSADLSLWLAHISKGTFSHVAAQDVLFVILFTSQNSHTRLSADNINNP